MSSSVASHESSVSVYYRDLYLNQWEDALLVAGGIVAALCSTLPSSLTIPIGVAALGVAAIGKGAPSLVAQVFWTPEGPFPTLSKRKGNSKAGRDYRSGAKGAGQRVRISWAPKSANYHGPNDRDAWTILGDLALVGFTLAALAIYSTGTGRVLPYFLLLTGLGFVVDAGMCLTEQALLSSALDLSFEEELNGDVSCKTAGAESESAKPGRGPRRPPKPTPTAAIGSRSIEAVLLGLFGVAAIFLVILPGDDIASVSALGLAALGKALPSILSAAGSSTQSS